MYGKILITCKLTVLTGLHIGGSSVFSSIGSVNNPVIRDAWSGAPLLPGSSLKGKLRTLLAREEAQSFVTKECKEDPAIISRLFGSSADAKNKAPGNARLQFADAFLLNGETLKQGSGYTEIKYENTISRLTGMANPRPVERIVRGAEFAVHIVYDTHVETEITEDFANLTKALKLLSMDYLGGHGSRGYGRVGFSEFSIKLLDETQSLDQDGLLNMLKDVENYALFPLQA